MERASKFEDMAPAERGRARDLPPIAAGGDGAMLDALLFPNRSLPNSGFAAVMAIVIASNVVFGVYFYFLGAWPVIGFCGLDIILVWLAFKLSYRQGRLHERVRVTAEELSVARVLPSGHESRWRLQPFWTEVKIDRPARHESQIRLISKGRTLVLGSFLSPHERAEFADALSRALVRARES